jgi:hypothetical protein
MIKRLADIVPTPKSSPIVDTLNRAGAIALAKRLQQILARSRIRGGPLGTEPLDERFGSAPTRSTT